MLLRFLLIIALKRIEINACCKEADVIKRSSIANWMASILFSWELSQMMGSRKVEEFSASTSFYFDHMRVRDFFFSIVC